MRKTTTDQILLPVLILTVSLCTYIAAQMSPTGNKDAFFLDLGIVIEPSMGDESVNRLVKAPSKEAKFFLDKVPSGSVFMASTKELQETLNRISEKIEFLESALRKDLARLESENKELRNMVAGLIEKQDSLLASTPFLSLAYPVPTTSEAGKDAGILDKNENVGEDEFLPEKERGEFPEQSAVSVEKQIEAGVTSDESVQSPTEESDREKLLAVDENRIFDKNVYMSAVFAYQREDYHTALEHFSALSLIDVDQKTKGNVLYWMADCYYGLGEYERALETLRKIEPLVQSDKVDDALVLTGLIYRNMGNEPQALSAFSRVATKFPESEYFRLAQMELRKKGK